MDNVQITVCDIHRFATDIAGRVYVLATDEICYFDMTHSTGSLIRDPVFLEERIQVCVGQSIEEVG
jgi:hypothetical protein